MLGWVRRRPLLFAAIVAGALLCASALDPRGPARLRLLDAQIERAQIENAGLAAENERLAREVKALTGDLATIERVAREDLGYVRPDEILFKLP